MTVTPEPCEHDRGSTASPGMSANGGHDGSGQMFDRIAGRYDLLNRLMSLGLDRGWRRQLARTLNLEPSTDACVLDVAAGTGDVALTIARIHRAAHVVALDPSPGMLRRAQTKLNTDSLRSRIQLTLGDGQRMPFATGHFAATCIAFGIRNVPDRARCLQEMRRVTRPGGVVAVLELAEPREGWLSRLARIHVRKIVPTLGAWLSSSHEYAYLQHSMAAFPPADQFLQTMTHAGLNNLQVQSMGLGAVSLFSGET